MYWKTGCFTGGCQNLNFLKNKFVLTWPQHVYACLLYVQHTLGQWQNASACLHSLFEQGYLRSLKTSYDQLVSRMFCAYSAVYNFDHTPHLFADFNDSVQVAHRIGVHFKCDLEVAGSLCVNYSYFLWNIKYFVVKVIKWSWTQYFENKILRNISLHILPHTDHTKTPKKQTNPNWKCGSVRLQLLNCKYNKWSC